MVTLPSAWQPFTPFGNGGGRRFVQPLLEAVVLRLGVAGEDFGNGCSIHASIYALAFHFHRDFPDSENFLSHYP